ncbi:hypothetical protein DTI93_07980 [Parasaccharibacter sp. TMW 2.1884]|uniref:hypothetical protein n=1 Tax=Parasaccharibacter sp. TMW 2.1884 TaxID=2267834 RepID=UPI001318DCE0|nr:hypothetical protein [Parasaccharibacter sp. TMW 2.1884]MCL1512319.1 hypothetical protein [Parasaccharibacter sp. TMW 2.1884]QGT75363.1 hypothetical protein GN304_06210 [Bombella sp. ESL0368]
MDTSPSSSHSSPARGERLLSATPSRQQQGGAIMGRVLLNLIWAVAHFVFSFLIQLTELFAPILLILGVGWSLLPHLVTVATANLGSLTEDQQTHEIVNHIAHTIPEQLIVAGHTLTPHGLIKDGLLLMALAAASSTAAAWLARRL